MMLMKKPKTKAHNPSISTVKSKNLHNVHSPLYTTNIHIKVNPVKRNSQKHINTKLSIMLNPFKSSTQLTILNVGIRSGHQ